MTPVFATPALIMATGPQFSARATRPLSRVRGRAAEGAAPASSSPSPSLTLPRFAGEGIAARLGAAARLIEVRS